jgi:hypothetical protein
MTLSSWMGTAALSLAVVATSCESSEDPGTGGSTSTGGSGGTTSGGTGGSGGSASSSGSGAAGGASYSCASPHPAWLLCEDFESGGGDFDTWFAGSKFNASVGTDDRGRIDLTGDPVHGGSTSLHMPAAASSDYQGASLSCRKCLGDVQQSPCDEMDSYEELYFRTWVRFDEQHQNVHHFLNIAGSQPDRFYSLGSSGCKRTGEHSIGATVDCERDTHNSFFYTYYPAMDCSPNCVDYMGQEWLDQNCQHCADIGMPTCDGPAGQQCCWGDESHPSPESPLPVGSWFCFEMMVKANTPNVNDGVMAYWVDGVLMHQVDDMLWRTVPEVALNRVALQHYNTTSDAEGHSNQVWFDDVVVSTERIHCD